MDDLVRDLSSPRWLFSVVLMGLVLNVVGSYLRTFLDSIVDRFRRSAHAKKNARQTRVDLMASVAAINSGEYAKLQFQSLRYGIKSVFAVAIGLLTYYLVSAIPLGAFTPLAQAAIGAFTWWNSAWYVNTEREISDALRLADSNGKSTEVMAPE